MGKNFVAVCSLISAQTSRRRVRMISGCRFLDLQRLDDGRHVESSYTMRIDPPKGRTRSSIEPYFCLSPSGDACLSINRSGAPGGWICNSANVCNQCLYVRLAERIPPRRHER